MSDFEGVSLRGFMPWLKVHHDIEVNHDCLKHAVERHENVVLYCITSDAHRFMSTAERGNVE
jgi:hypothetical protein